MFYYERKLKKEGFDLIIGIDEAGRGPLAGPVVAGAVTLNTYRFKNRIDDSKKLTAEARKKAYLEIIDNSTFGVGIVDEKVIDRINILQATRLAMKEAVLSLIDKLNSVKYSQIHLIVDGDIAIDLDFPCLGIVRGDSKSKSIASASIIAKVTRDAIMDSYHKLYPGYGFIRNKGYPTKEHRDILKKIGPSLIHRKSFCCV